MWYQPWKLRIGIPTFFVIVALLGACGDDPTGPTLQIEGTYTGDWTFQSFDAFGAPIATAICPGTMTLADQDSKSFGGAYLVTASGDCTGLSPISGEIVDGQVRGDGGLNFTVTTAPFVGSPVGGCVLAAADSRMNGGVNGTTLSVFTTGSLSCPTGTGQVQILMEGSR